MRSRVSEAFARSGVDVAKAWKASAAPNKHDRDATGMNTDGALLEWMMGGVLVMATALVLKQSVH